MVTHACKIRQTIYLDKFHQYNAAMYLENLIQKEYVTLTEWALKQEIHLDVDRDKIHHLKTNKAAARFNAIVTEIAGHAKKNSTKNIDIHRVIRVEGILGSDKEHLEKRLKQLKPWRKGPFNLFDIAIEAEWQSDMKWDRLAPYLPDISGKIVGDIGANSGYYMFRMLPFKPKFILGVDPYLLYFFQYHAINVWLSAHFKETTRVYLPIKFEELICAKPTFDLVLCMGILYHSRSPHTLLREMHKAVIKGGVVVIETLIYPGEEMIAFSPPGRYAKMGNVYFIPTLNCLKSWITQAGFRDVTVCDVNHTSVVEQRVTPWSSEESLGQFLDPQDPGKTIEGYPAPARVLITATKA